MPKNNMIKSELNLPVELQNEIIGKSTEESVIQRVATQVVLPGNGSATKVITGRPKAYWVDEAEPKPVSKATIEQRVMQPYKLATTMVVSEELVQDDVALYNKLAQDLPAALGSLFDQTILQGTAPGSNFDVLSDVDAVDIKTKGVYKGALEAIRDVSAAGGDLNAFVLRPTAEVELLGETDGNGRPLFIDNVSEQGTVGRILGRPTFKASYSPDSVEPDPTFMGIAGDWNDARWGVVEGSLTVRVSDQATVDLGDGKLTSLWQTNQVGILAEARVGFVCADKKRFKRIVNSALAPKPGAGA